MNLLILESTAQAFFCRAKKELLIVTLVTFSSNIRNFEKHPKFSKYPHNKNAKKSKRLNKSQKKSQKFQQKDVIKK